VLYGTSSIRVDMYHNLSIKLDLEFKQRCEVFISLLGQWGRVHNLSGRLDRASIEENIIDSIYPLKYIDEFKSFLDVGTGAGYPGMILAMARSDIKGFLVEPRAKRVAFLNFVKSSLGLNNLVILQQRIEDVILDHPIELITSRAVTNTKLLLDITSHLRDKNTKYLFYKGSNIYEELEQITLEEKEIFKKDDRQYLYIRKIGDI